MLWFARASVGLAGFLGKILVALKKLFSLILDICIPVPGSCILLFGDPCQVSKMFLNKIEFLDNSPQSTHGLNKNKVYFLARKSAIFVCFFCNCTIYAVLKLTTGTTLSVLKRNSIVFKFLVVNYRLYYFVSLLIVFWSMMSCLRSFRGKQTTLWCSTKL